jgi:hypothetical protein
MAEVMMGAAGWTALRSTSSQAVRVTLRDGRRALLRPMTPADREFYLVGF